MVDITPPAGTHLGGTWGTLRPAEIIEERLYARAAVFAQGGRKFCILQPDLEIATRPWTDRIRKGVSARCGIPLDAILVHFPQPHSTPPLGNFIIDEEFLLIPPEHEYLRGAQSAYCEFAATKIVEAACLAESRLRPIRIAAGSAVRNDLAFNRRGVMRNGTVGMPWLYSSLQKPLGPTEYRYLEGPTDPEVGVLCARDDDMNMVAMILHFTCHPVNVFALCQHTVSPDWPGIWCQEMQAACGPGSIALVLNGCCGNINPWPAFEPDFVPDHRRMGRALAETTGRILRTLRFSECPVLDWRVRHLALPLKEAAAEAVATAAKKLAEHPAPVWQKDNPKQVTWEWMDAAMLMSVELERRRNPCYDCEIQALRIGDTALVGLPGEPFVEGQLEIKIKSPFYPTYVAHNCADFAGYIAPRASYARGGHEIRDTPAKWAKLEPGALETMTEAVGVMLRDLGGR